MIMKLLLCHELLLKTSGHMFASHAINDGCLVVLACFTTASIKASSLGVQPSECRMQTAKTRLPPRTFTHAPAILPSLEPTQPPFFFANNCSKSAVDCHTETLPDVCVRSSLPAFSPIILAASAANLHPCLASLLNCFSHSSFFIMCLIPKKMAKTPLYLFICFLSVLHAEPFS